MNKIVVGLILFLAALLPGCGGGGGGDETNDPNAPATVHLAAAQNLALADGSDAVNVLAEVTKLDGAAVADGTLVTFTVPAGSGNLSAAVAATNNGIATVSLTRTSITGAKNQVVTVTATAGKVSGEMGVKFINQPSSVDLFIATDTSVANLAALQLTVNSSLGATFDNTTAKIFTLNNAAVGTSLAAASFNALASSTRIGLINANGINTGITPIIKATFAVAPGTGLPSFSIDPTPANFSATDLNGLAVSPALTAANFVLSMTFDTE